MVTAALLGWGAKTWSEQIPTVVFLYVRVPDLGNEEQGTAVAAQGSTHTLIQKVVLEFPQLSRANLGRVQGGREEGSPTALTGIPVLASAGATI